MNLDSPSASALLPSPALDHVQGSEISTTALATLGPPTASGNFFFSSSVFILYLCILVMPFSPVPLPDLGNKIYFIYFLFVFDLL